MYKKMVVVALLVFVLSFVPTHICLAQETSSNNSQNGASVLSDLISVTSDLSQFFGNAMGFMRDAIGYLTGGIHAAHQFQQGTDIINDMLQHGPPHPAPVEPVMSDNETSQMPVITTEPSVVSNEEGSTPQVPVSDISNEEFTSLLSSYKELSVQELDLTDKIASNNSPELKEVLKDVKQAKEMNKNKILLSINQDIESKEFQKLHLLVDYVNSQGGNTTKLFFEIIDETKMKLQFSLIQAQNMGLSVDIQMIEGQLELVFSLTSEGAE